MKLSLIFPAYNEADTITGVLRDFILYCQRNNVDHEIIVVNDGSTDATHVQVQQFTIAHPTVRLIDHEKNRGYGAALRSGFSAARGDYIFFTDGDGQFLPEDLNQTLPLLDPQTIILGYRQHRAEGADRRLNAWLWGQMIRVLFGFHVRDLNCAWKLFPRTLLKDMELSTNGAFINTELLYYARQKKLAFKEIPVYHYSRKSGRPTGANIQVIGRAFQELRLFLKQRRNDR